MYFFMLVLSPHLCFCQGSLSICLPLLHLLRGWHNKVPPAHGPLKFPLFVYSCLRDSLRFQLPVSTSQLTDTWFESLSCFLQLPKVQYIRTCLHPRPPPFLWNVNVRPYPGAVPSWIKPARGLASRRCRLYHRHMPDFTCLFPGKRSWIMSTFLGWKEDSRRLVSQLHKRQFYQAERQITKAPDSYNLLHAPCGCPFSVPLSQ